jgi:hypothetical protein
MAKLSKLEEIANEQRKALTIKNKFSDTGEHYTATNTNALSDEETPAQGKGTGSYLDVNNGGSQIDIQARKEGIRFNDYKKGEEYTKPDTSNLGNIIY